MQTFFTQDQLKIHPISEVDEVLKSCVHCGFCNATCPTYLLTGNELDGPRGRIYLMKEMFEKDIVSDTTRFHIDRCLTCTACMTTCPSGVNYRNLVDHGRAKIAQLDGKRKITDRFLRRLLLVTIPRPTLFRLSLIMAKLMRPFLSLLPKSIFGRLKTLLNQAPSDLPPPSHINRPGLFKTPLSQDNYRGVVIIWPGCAQQVLAPNINVAAIRLLNRMGYDVRVPETGCCGALPHHLGEEKATDEMVRHNVHALTPYLENANEAPVAIITTTSGCGPTLKDYHRWGENTDGIEQKIAHMSYEISEFLYEHREGLGLLPKPDFQAPNAPPKKIGFHPPCTLQHGLKASEKAQTLMRDMGFEVTLPKDSHLCCGAAGIYSILQDDLSSQLQANKRQALINLVDTDKADLFVTANMGCAKQIESKELPFIHIVELLDQATHQYPS